MVIHSDLQVIKDFTPMFAQKINVMMKILRISSPNWNLKPEYEAHGDAYQMKNTKYIIIHHTATSAIADVQAGSVELLQQRLEVNQSNKSKEKSAIEILINPNQTTGVSAHYLIPRQEEFSDQLISLVDDNKRAWHAGVSARGDDVALNNFSIGIEINNNGINEHFSNSQMAHLVALILGLKKAYNINPFNILGHHEIAPDRKIDPSNLFNWQILANYGLVYCPQIPLSESRVIYKIGNKGNGIASMQKKLIYWGYSYVKANDLFDHTTENAIISLQRRYLPQEYLNTELNGCWTNNLETTIDELLNIRDRYNNGEFQIKADLENIKNDGLELYLSKYSGILEAADIS